MADQVPILSAADAERFRAYERQRHDSLAASYHDFFTPVTALAISHLCNAVHLAPAIELLDVATGPGSLGCHKQAIRVLEQLRRLPDQERHIRQGVGNLLLIQPVECGGQHGFHGGKQLSLHGRMGYAASPDVAAISHR